MPKIAWFHDGFDSHALSLGQKPPIYNFDVFGKARVGEAVVRETLPIPSITDLGRCRVVAEGARQYTPDEVCGVL